MPAAASRARGADVAAASAAARSPAPVIRYRCRGGRPAGGSVSQPASSSPRSLKRIRIGYSVPASSPTSLPSS